MRINYLETIADYWNSQAAEYRLSHPEHNIEEMHPSWGLWHIAEKEIKLLEGKLVCGSTLVELGCGTGHDAVGFARMGLDVSAVDISDEQLSRAIKHPNVRYYNAAAEKLPFTDSSIDILTSDHGAFDHSPPEVLIVEARRVLKRGGTLAICTYSPLAHICYNNSDQRLSTSLQNDYPTNKIRYDGRLVAPEFSYGEWIRIFRKHNFAVDKLEELRPKATATAYFSDLMTVEWASRWPCDIAWVVTKT